MKRNILCDSLLILGLLILSVTSCSEDSSFSSGDSGSGQGGSMARFTISEKGDYLYTVDDSRLKTFSLEESSQPRYLKDKDKNLGLGIETIFVRDTLLFIGSQDGMHIYNVTRPEFPQFMSTTSHMRSCDPVVASGNYAYVTLNVENAWCGRGRNVLQVYDISNPYRPEWRWDEGGLMGPRGLGVKANKLFVCDNGLKVYDITNPVQPVWKNDLSEIPEASGIDAYDVIPLEGLLLLTGKNGLYQFAYSAADDDDFSLRFLSKIPVNR